MSKFDENFDDDKLEKAIKKAKRNSIIRSISIALVIAILTMVVGLKINESYNIKSINEADKKIEEQVASTVLNGYVSRTDYTAGFLGGKIQYNVSRIVGGRPVLLENKVQSFGINPTFIGMSGQSRATVDSDWGMSGLWDSGYRKMLFFHPDIEYKKYKNDLKNLDKIPDDKIIEVGISLDKSYKISEIADLAFDMRNINTKWIWLNTYDEESMDEYKQEVKEYEPESCGIGESDVRGMEYRENKGNIYSGITSFNSSYNSWIKSLEESNLNENKELYNRLVKDGKELSKDAEILGFVVEGTKEELKSLLNKKYIKATSFGIIVDPLY